MTNKPDQLEQECWEFLAQMAYVTGISGYANDPVSQHLATFVQQKVDEAIGKYKKEKEGKPWIQGLVDEAVLAERKRCVEVVAEDVMQREGRKWKRWSDSPDPNVLTSHDYYTRLLEANTEEGEK